VGALLGTALALALAASPAWSAVPYTVQPGETLAGIAAVDGLSTSTLAAYNGISPYTYLVAGQTIEIPYASEVGATTTATAAPTTTATTAAPTTTTATTATSTASGGHTVIAGESLYSIAEANGISPYTLAADNGLSIDSVIVPGQTLAVPAATVSAAPTTTTTTPTTTSTTTTTTETTAPTTTTTGPPAPGLSPIYCPCGTDYLATPAADAWNAMRQDSLTNYGVDLYPNGPLSAYRTYDQQAYLYQQYLDGTGAPADPPGTSQHNYGIAVDVATPEMRSIIDQIGGAFGWAKTSAPTEWWHVTYGG
jgi:LysM repeat protein